MSNKFNVGDKVFDLRYGFGEVTECNEKALEFPLKIRFEHVRNYYTEDGKLVEDDKHPSLLTLEQAKALGYEPPKKKVKKYPCLYHNSLVNSKVVSLATYATLEEARSSRIAESYEVIRLITEIPELIEEVEVEE